jgi:AcrR family transcriptional regulator
MEDQGPGAGKRTIASGRGKECRDRRRIMAAVLSLSGEIGYRQVTVRKVLAHGGGDVRQFYSHFHNLEGCFAAAYDAEAERLCTTLVDAAAAASGWRERTHAVLTGLLGFAAERPPVARALLCEVQVAGGDALVKRDEVLERLTAAIGCPSQEAAEAGFPPTPFTHAFVVGAVEGLICSRLVRGEAEELPAAAPDLMFLIVSVCLGRDAAFGT